MNQGERQETEIRTSALRLLQEGGVLELPDYFPVQPRKLFDKIASVTGFDTPAIAIGLRTKTMDDAPAITRHPPVATSQAEPINASGSASP